MSRDQYQRVVRTGTQRTPMAHRFVLDQKSRRRSHADLAVENLLLCLGLPAPLISPPSATPDADDGAVERR